MVRRLAVAGTLAAGVVALPLTAWGGARSLSLEGERLIEVRGDPVAVERAAAEMAPRHPADYYLHLLPALAHASRPLLRPEKVLPWANRAMFLNPAASWPHRLAARCLLLVGRPAQARIEYRLAFPAADRGDLLAEIIRTFRTPEELLDSVPGDIAATGMLLDVLASQGKHPLRHTAGRLAIDRYGESEPMLVRLASSARALEDADESLRLAERALKLAPDSVGAAGEKASTLSALGRKDEAVATFEQALVRHPADMGLLSWAASYFVQVGRTARARELLSRAHPLASDNTTRAGLLVTEAQSYVAEGKVGRGIDSYRAASRIAPAWPGARWHLVGLLERDGRLTEAMAEVEALYALESPAQKPQIDATRDRIAARLKEIEFMRRLSPEPTPTASPDGLEEAKE